MGSVSGEGGSTVVGSTRPTATPMQSTVVGPGVAEAAELAGWTAAHDLSGHRLVVPGPGSTVAYADHTHLADLGDPVWLTVGAAMAGDPVQLVWYGTVVEPSWSWTPGPLFVGVGGLIATSAPATGYSRQVGSAVNSSTIWLDPQPGIALTT